VSTILVVEDELLVRMQAADFLRDEGFDVLEADNAAEAMAIFAAASVDLVFTDVHMPGDMDGCDLADWIRQNHPDVGLLVTSGKAQVCGAIGNLPQDVVVIPKPYDIEAVNARIRTLLADHGA
jgi:DNA-binding response OmpR family regulator